MLSIDSTPRPASRSTANGEIGTITLPPSGSQGHWRVAGCRTDGPCAPRRTGCAAPTPWPPVELAGVGDGPGIAGALASRQPGARMIAGASRRLTSRKAPTTASSSRLRKTARNARDVPVSTRVAVASVGKATDQPLAARGTPTLPASRPTSNPRLYRCSGLRLFRRLLLNHRGRSVGLLLHLRAMSNQRGDNRRAP